jgi:hypothetical protein
MARAANLNESYEPTLMRPFTADSTIRLHHAFGRRMANATAIILDVQMRP